jgi:hypothetical protein
LGPAVGGDAAAVEEGGELVHCVADVPAVGGEWGAEGGEVFCLVVGDDGEGIWAAFSV